MPRPYTTILDVAKISDMKANITKKSMKKPGR